MKKIALLSLFLVPMVSQAARQFGDAGCGLGSVVFGNKGGFVQIFAATTNGTSGSQTFGISSGTSNCVDDGAVAQNKALDMYLDSNKVALATEAARGNGDTVANLAGVLGCSDAALLGSALQKNYSNVFTQGVSTDELSSSIKSVIRSDASLAGTCAI